jgi:hypothetical protein
VKNEKHNRAELDRATAQRLARLRTMPVDTSRLERWLRAEIPSPSSQGRTERSSGVSMWLRPARAVAAGFALLMMLVGALVLSSGGPVLASPNQMAQVHEELVSGRMSATRVDSVEGANRVLMAQWPQSPKIPSLPHDDVTACCMHSVGDKNLACVLLKADGVPVTMTVANAADMRLPSSPTTTRNGVAYHVQAHGQLNMVMTERYGRWVCLTGELPAERLMDLASRLQF